MTPVVIFDNYFFRVSRIKITLLFKVIYEASPNKTNKMHKLNILEVETKTELHFENQGDIQQGPLVV